MFHIAVKLDGVFEEDSWENAIMEGWCSIAGLAMAAGGRGGLPLPRHDLRVLLKCAVDEEWAGLPKARCMR